MYEIWVAEIPRLWRVPTGVLYKLIFMPLHWILDYACLGTLTTLLTIHSGRPLSKNTAADTHSHTSYILGGILECIGLYCTQKPISWANHIHVEMCLAIRTFRSDCRKAKFKEVLKHRTALHAHDMFYWAIYSQLSHYIVGPFKRFRRSCCSQKLSDIRPEGICASFGRFCR